jgi:serine/threonine-protein kinase
VLTVAVVGWWIGVGRYTQTPDFVNLPKATAEAAARHDGLTLYYGEGTYNENVPKDVVLSQNPPANQKILKGGTITLVLSLGPERHEVPDLTGVAVDAAKSQLDDAKLKLKQDDGAYSDTVPKGTIISFSPPAGTQLKPGDTVTVTVSRGHAPVTVPQVTNLNVNDARNQLQGMQLTVVEQDKPSDQPPGTVLAQDPAPGTGVDRNAKVTLQVSSGNGDQVMVPDVRQQPCQQAQQQLQSMNLRVRVDFNPNGTVQAQQPAPGTPVALQTEIAIQCF